MLSTLFGVMRLLSLLLAGLLLVTFIYPLLRASSQQALVAWWSRRILKIFSIRLQLNHPERLPAGAAFLVLNHISWIDIYVLNACYPVYFIAKADIARWPVIGYLCKRAGTLFIERHKRHAVRNMNHQVKSLLNQGAHVACFPEGTTTNGTHLLPFHANLLQAALDAQVSIVPVALQYFDARGALAAAVDYSGRITLWQTMQAMWQAAQHGGIVAQLDVLPAIEEIQSRHTVAHAAQAAISTATGFRVLTEAEKSHQPQDGIE